MGTVTGKVSSSGVVSGRAEFGPFGEPISAASDASNYKFTGREQVGAGLQYNRNRMYSPFLGRFMSEDPIGFSGSPDGNLFAYCGNDPINYSDPMGLSPLSDGLMTGVAGVADGGVDALSGFIDPNNANSFGLEIVPDEYNPGAQLRKWYHDYTQPTYGAYRCMEGYSVSRALSGFGSGVLFSYGAGMAAGGIGAGGGVVAEGAATEEMASAPKPNNCFPAGTVVQLADGSTKHIEDITDKDVVWARDDSTGETRACHIKRTFHKEAKELVVLSFGEVGDTSGKIVQTVRCTVEHPFFVSGRGWVGAKDLGIGTEIVTRAGPNLVVRKVERESHPGGVGIYNFEVEGLHSYFVGEASGGVWVHNLSGVEELPVAKCRYADPVDFASMTNRERDAWMGLRDSIKADGIKSPVDYIKDINGNYWILDGNHRLQAAEFLKMETIPGRAVTLPQLPSYRHWGDVHTMFNPDGSSRW